MKVVGFLNLRPKMKRGQVLRNIRQRGKQDSAGTQIRNMHKIHVHWIIHVCCLILCLTIQDAEAAGRLLTHVRPHARIQKVFFRGGPTFSFFKLMSGSK